MQINLEVFNGLSPARRNPLMKANTLYTPQHKGHTHQKSDGPLTPPYFHVKSKKNKGWEDDSIDHSFLIRGSPQM